MLDSPAWVDIVEAAGIAVADIAAVGIAVVGTAAAGTVVVGTAVVGIEEVDILVESLFLDTRFAADKILGIHTMYDPPLVVENRTGIAVVLLHMDFVD